MLVRFIRAAIVEWWGYNLRDVGWNGASGRAGGPMLIRFALLSGIYVSPT
jgi:hypothetical protein